MLLFIVRLWIYLSTFIKTLLYNKRHHEEVLRMRMSPSPQNTFLLLFPSMRSINQFFKYYLKNVKE